MNPSSIEILLNGVDITDRVVYSQTSFTSQVNPMQGSFRVVCRDPDQDFAPVCGQKLKVYIDGVPLFGGYVMVIDMGNFLPAVDTALPNSVKTRRWTLSGPDFNVLFDKRILYDPANPKVSPKVPSGKRTITKAFRYMMNNLLNVPVNLDHTTHVDTILDDDGEEAAYGSEENGSMYVQAGSTWREQMDDFADHSGLIYYIDGDFAIHLHSFESVLVPFPIMDKHGVNSIPFRSGTYIEDYTRMATEALVWGGSALKGTNGVVFAKYPNAPANNPKEQTALDRIATYGRWQVAEERAGQNNYLTQFSVNKRAKIMIMGPTGVPPTQGLEGGFSAPLQSFDCTWFAHDVPGKQHIVPGSIVDIILYSQGTPGHPMYVRLPLRSMSITFPTLPTDNPGGQTYVQFEGQFGMAYSDRRFLWEWLKNNQRKRYKTNFTTVASNESGSIASGAYATMFPTEKPNGTRKAFTFPFTFFIHQVEVFKNGLYQRWGTDFTYSAENKQVTFTHAPATGSDIWAYGLVSQ